MTTATTNASIRPIVERIVDILNDYLDVGDALNPTGTTRPVRLIRSGWPVPKALAYNLCPAIYVHMSDWDDADEYVGQQMHGLGITLSVIENILDTDMAVDHVYDYIDELKKLCYVTHRHWKRVGDSTLYVVTTKPRGGNIAPVQPDDDHFLVQADLNMTVVRQFDFY